MVLEILKSTLAKRLSNTNIPNNFYISMGNLVREIDHGTVGAGQFTMHEILLNYFFHSFFLCFDNILLHFFQKCWKKYAVRKVNLNLNVRRIQKYQCLPPVELNSKWS